MASVPLCSKALLFSIPSVTFQLPELLPFSTSLSENLVMLLARRRGNDSSPGSWTSTCVQRVQRVYDEEFGGAEGAGAGTRKINWRLWAGARARPQLIFGIHAARALLPGEPLERWPSHGLLQARALMSMLLDHRVAEEEAAALEGLTEDVELVSRHCRDGRAPGRVETAERGRHLRGHANSHVRRAFAPVYTAGAKQLTISL